LILNFQHTYIYILNIHIYFTSLHLKTFIQIHGLIAKSIFYPHVRNALEKPLKKFSKGRTTKKEELFLKFRKKMTTKLEGGRTTTKITFFVASLRSIHEKTICFTKSQIHRCFDWIRKRTRLNPTNIFIIQLFVMFAF